MLTKKALIPLLFVAATLSACSYSMTKADLEGLPLAQEPQAFFGDIPFFYGGERLQLDSALLMAYTATADRGDYPREHCQGKAKILAKVKQNSEKSSWTVGAAFIPLWPILPVDETWTYELSAQIYCDDSLVRHMEFIEEQTIKATLFGRMRGNKAREASDEMHRKLIQRMHFELSSHRNADLNAATDY